MLFFLWKGNFSNFCKCGINHLSFSRPNDCRQDEKKNLCKKSFCPNFCLWFSKVYLNKWEQKCMLCWCFQIQQTCIVAKDHDGNFCRICVVRKKNKNVKKTQKKNFNFKFLLPSIFNLYNLCRCLLLCRITNNRSMRLRNG